MKYKVGDRVTVGKSSGYCSSIVEFLDKNNYISTVRQVKYNEIYSYYILEGLGEWPWEDYHLEGLALGQKPEPEPEPTITTITRFELMDL